MLIENSKSGPKCKNFEFIPDQFFKQLKVIFFLPLKAAFMAISKATCLGLIVTPLSSQQWRKQLVNIHSCSGFQEIFQSLINLPQLEKGASPNEINILNFLSVNLHLMMVILRFFDKICQTKILMIYKTLGYFLSSDRNQIQNSD